jgi:hypothetical protein
MSKETPKDDPRQRTDWGSHSQTDKPWKGPPEKEQAAVHQGSITAAGQRDAVDCRLHFAGVIQ